LSASLPGDALSNGPFSTPAQLPALRRRPALAISRAAATATSSKRAVTSFDSAVRLRPDLYEDLPAFPGAGAGRRAELERAREKFNFTYLPEESEKLFREALGCYSAGHFNAFASMCRRTAQAVFHDLGENGRLRIFNQINEAREMAEIDVETFNVVKKVLFGSDADPWPSMPEIAPYEAGVLLELVKDMLYQAYVRKGKLQQAMMVRRFFAEETLDKITPIGRVAGAD